MIIIKGLNQFIIFSAGPFLKDKKLILTGVGDWKDFDTKAHLGTKVEVVIAEDKTVYKPKANGDQISNLYEKMTIKVAKDVKIPVGTEVIVVNPTATVYGEYRNQLSIKADDVVPVGNGGKP